MSYKNTPTDVLEGWLARAENEAAEWSRNERYHIERANRSAQLAAEQTTAAQEMRAELNYRGLEVPASNEGEDA